MIIAKIIQNGTIITLQDVIKTFRYSSNLQMQFVKDAKYKDYILTGWYRRLRDKNEILLNIDENGTFYIPKEIYNKNGTVYFSFCLSGADGTEVHLGEVEYTIECAFGDTNMILPDVEETWITVVSMVVESRMSRIWDNTYKPKIEEKINIIDGKVAEVNSVAEGVTLNANNAQQSADNASNSANLAQGSAVNANLAKDKALEHSNNAEKFKNDASNFANSANTAKTEASKSATNASNSATNALESANTAKVHLDSVNVKVAEFNKDYASKADAFNVDYTAKVSEFNTNVQNANTTLDKKIVDANTNLDKKVTDSNTALDAKINKANTDIDKKVTDANNALDKKINDTQGVMDTKVSIATEKADIATSKATELSDAVDKVNYLEDALDTKLTQPYVSSGEIENATIADSDEGMLRNLKIYGKCTQNVEENIVPTPERPVPIISKKITVGEEVVKLRSLKESVNLFDKNINGFKLGFLRPNGEIGASDVFMVSDYITVKAGTKYIHNLLDGFRNSTKLLFDSNKNVILDLSSSTFTTPSNCCYVRYQIAGIDNRTLTEEDIRNVNNSTMFVEGETIPSSYIPPTVRDYKIVDHVNKRSYIERNVSIKELTSKDVYNMDGLYAYTTLLPNSNSYDISAFFCNKLYYLKKDNATINTFCGSGVKLFEVLLDKEHRTLATAKQWFDENKPIVLYQLATPVIEEIPYVETDTSDYGSSWQDTTSPSFGIPSKIEKVDTLEITCCGKNLINVIDYKNVTLNGVTSYKLSDGGIKYEGTAAANYNRNIVDGMYLKKGFYTLSRFGGVNYRVFVRSKLSGGRVHVNSYTNTTFEITEDDIVYIYCSIDNGTQINITFYPQLEVGNTATEYQPYVGTTITHTLKNPLLGINGVRDTINLKNLSTDRRFKPFILGNAHPDIVKDTKKEKTQVFSFPSPFVSNKVCCEQLKNESGIDKELFTASIERLWLAVKKERLRENSVTGLREWLKDNPLTFYGETTPTTEPLDPILVEKLKKLTTQYPITNIISNAPLEFDYKMNLENWHKVVSGEVENAKDVIYNMQVKQNNLEVMQLQSALETAYNLDLLKLGGI